MSQHFKCYTVPNHTVTIDGNIIFSPDVSEAVEEAVRKLDHQELEEFKNNYISPQSFSSAAKNEGSKYNFEETVNQIVSAVAAELRDRDTSLLTKLLGASSAAFYNSVLRSTHSKSITASIAYAKFGANSKSKSKSKSEFGSSVSKAVWEENRELLLWLFPHCRKTAIPWENLPLPAPPGPDWTDREIYDLARKERQLVHDGIRQQEIIDQATAADITEVLRPLGIDDVGGYDATKSLVTTVLDIAERVGYAYKLKFARLRPNQVGSHLRPFLSNPPHESYPSNHAFQLFSVAEVMTRMLPENPLNSELFYVAQRVAENREAAGIHYASDSYAGREMARMFAPYMFYACRRLMRDAMQEWF